MEILMLFLILGILIGIGFGWLFCLMVEQARKKKMKPPVDGQGRGTLIDGWRLIINIVGERHPLMLEHPEFKNLFKIYNWYLTRDSEKYNIKSQQGYEIICRCNIVGMKMEKVKVIEEKYLTQENEDDET